MDDGSLYFELFFGLVEDLLSDGRRKLRVAAVVQRYDIFSFIVVAHPAFIAAISACARREHGRAQRGWVDGLVCELEVHG